MFVFSINSPGMGLRNSVEDYLTHSPAQQPSEDEKRWTLFHLNVFFNFFLIWVIFSKKSFFFIIIIY